VRTTNNNSTGKVVIPLGKFQNKWGPVRYDAAGTTGQRKIWWLGLSNIADASVSQMWNTYFYSRLISIEIKNNCPVAQRWSCKLPRVWGE